MSEVHLPVTPSPSVCSCAESTPDMAAHTLGAFEPRIVALVCRWCTYAGADLAGTSRMTYPSNVRTIMLPCTGRIDISIIVRAFLQGADGVIVSGCHPGDCHYTSGNYRARRRWMLLRDLLDTLGVDLRRLDLAWISAAEGAKWVKTIRTFTEDIRTLGPYQAMREIAADRVPDLTIPSAPDIGTLEPATAGTGGDSGMAVDPALLAALRQALEKGTSKAILGWKKRSVPGALQAVWISDPENLKNLLVAENSGNLTRLFKRTEIRQLSPVGIIARKREALALNVLLQEKQIGPGQVTVFAVDTQGKFLGTVDLTNTGAINTWYSATPPPADRPSGFSDHVWESLDRLMALSIEARWNFWKQHFTRCIRCYACRGSCPMCNCAQCFTDKNMPQWFPTAADGPGNFSWHLVRAFHLAGRCIGCGACDEACPAGIPLGLLNAAMARSALKHFGYRAGIAPDGVPLQADFRPNDQESFIL
ncbi:MAG: hydrogenase iron-sulfur subunit [Phycisphaerae bacterium]